MLEESEIRRVLVGLGAGDDEYVQWFLDRDRWVDEHVGPGALVSPERYGYGSAFDVTVEYLTSEPKEAEAR